MNDLSVVIPVFNENHGIIATIKNQLEALGAEVVVVDDGSEDPYPDAIKHGSNFGYGAALMTGIKNAKRPLIATIDGDGQHSAAEVQKLYTAFKLLDIEMIIGARRLKSEKIIRRIGRNFLNIIASLLAKFWLVDLNSGIRIFKRDRVLGYSPILCKQFSFTTSLTLSMLCDGYSVEWFPVNVVARQHGKSRVKVIRHGFITLYYILRIGFALRTRKLRAFLRRFRERGQTGCCENILSNLRA